MDLIYTDSNFVEKGYLNNANLDLDIGKYNVSSNDFELTLSETDRDPSFADGSLFYSENTEFGGIVDHLKVSTSDSTVTYKGYTFRGFLQKEYIQPPEDSAYLTLKGDANKCLDTLIGDRFDSLYVVDEIGNSGITVNYQIRDMNLLDAIERMLTFANAKLDIKHKIDGRVHLKAVPINDLSDTIQYDESYKLAMVVEAKNKPYNHILALGKGELLDRLRVNLYIQSDGSWNTAQTVQGINRITYKYEDTNEEDADALKKKAIEKIAEANGTDTLSISFDADNADLFDIVSAKESITGISFKEQITQKILKISGETVDISYKVGE